MAAGLPVHGGDDAPATVALDVPAAARAGGLLHWPQSIYPPPHNHPTMDGEDAAVLAAVEDEYARAILAAVAAEPLSGPELVDRLDASKPTVYRRLSTLEDLDLVATRVEPDDGGHHRNVYVAAVEAIHVHVEPQALAVEVDREAEDAVDRFRQLVGDLS